MNAQGSDRSPHHQYSDSSRYRHTHLAHSLPQPKHSFHQVGHHSHHHFRHSSYRLNSLMQPHSQSLQHHLCKLMELSPHSHKLRHRDKASLRFQRLHHFGHHNLGQCHRRSCHHLALDSVYTALFLGPLRTDLDPKLHTHQGHIQSCLVHSLHQCGYRSRCLCHHSSHRFQRALRGYILAQLHH